MPNLKSIILDLAKSESMDDTWTKLQKACAVISKMDREKNADATFDKVTKLIGFATTVQYLMMAPHLTGAMTEEGANV